MTGAIISCKQNAITTDENAKYNSFLLLFILTAIPILSSLSITLCPYATPKTAEKLKISPLSISLYGHITSIINSETAPPVSTSALLPNHTPPYVIISIITALIVAKPQPTSSP